LYFYKVVIYLNVNVYVVHGKSDANGGGQKISLAKKVVA